MLVSHTCWVSNNQSHFDCNYGDNTSRERERERERCIYIYIFFDNAGNSDAIAEKLGARDIFLHKNDMNSASWR